MTPATPSTSLAPARPGGDAPDLADAEGLATTIADYYLGWYDGDPERMARALHPELTKRGWLRDPSGAMDLTLSTAGAMIELTRRAVGARPDPAERRYEIRAVEVHRDVASACVYAVPYVDYLHLIRTADGWRIINALWCET
jgi:hypothetical protein